MEKKSPLISVVIPTKNGGKTIKACIEAIQNQTLYKKTEIIVIDSGSTDNTLSILEVLPVKIHKIEPEVFNHGLTRNYGVSIAQGEFIVFTVQDAKAVTNNWLELMLKHFADNEVMGVCGQQIVPHDPNKNPMEWFRPYSEPQPKFIQFKNSKFEKLSGQTQYQYCGWDDVNAMYRKTALGELPFIQTSFAEDMLWAKKALSKGYKLVYDYNSRVYHYHYHNFSFMFKRTYTLLYHINMFFKHRPRNEKFFYQFIKIFYAGIFKAYIPDKRIYWILYNIRMLTAKHSAAIIFRINSIFLKPGKLYKAHNFWVGKPPQSKVK